MHWCSISPIGSKPGPMYVRGSITDKDNNYLLEIGNGCTADPDLLALCALAPEIREFLERFESPLAEMLLTKWNKLTLQFHRDQRQPDEKPAEKAG